MITPPESAYALTLPPDPTLQEEEPVTSLVLSSELTHPGYEPTGVTICNLEGYSVALYKFVDGEPVSFIDLSGQEMQALIKAYRRQSRRYTKRLSTLLDELPQRKEHHEH